MEKIQMKKYNVFKILAVVMIGFGIVVGLIFPFFMLLATSVSPSEVMTLRFFLMTTAAGILVGVVNLILARQVVGSRVKLLSKHMKKVQLILDEKSRSDVFNNCIGTECLISEISKDAIGQGAESFNSLVIALSTAFKTEGAVKDFTELLSSRLELDKLSVDALKQLLESLNTFAGAIVIEKEGSLEILTSYAIARSHDLAKNKMVMDSFQTQQGIVIDVPENIAIEGVLLEIQPKCVILEPIIYKNVMLGLIVLASLEAFNEEKKSLLKQYGQGLALAFKNAITHDQLQTIAANDPLTGALNRRFGMERLKDEYVRAIRTNQPLGIIIIDIDHFKKVNDTYGHLVGDQVLVALRNVAKLSLREGDIFFRYGGEEFIAILPGASKKDVHFIAERFRRQVQELEVHHAETVIKVTVSIGGASLPEHQVENPISLIEIADNNLYYAKENGRNQVSVN